jgi:hypothetical protein
MATTKNTKREETFMSRHWRGLVGFEYVFVCLCDFVLLPCIYFWVQQYEKEAVNDAFREWQPLTTQGGGLFHMAHMAIMGVSSWGKTQERTAEAKP